MKDKLEIISLPHPALRQRSQKVGVINETTRALISKMIDQAIMWEKDRPNETTVGLAAVQIGQLFKVIIVREDFDSKKDPVFMALINPKITKFSGQRSAKLEGCLSVPDFYANVERYEEVRVSALSANGQPIKFRATGFLARVIQHEIDHLRGIMTVDQAVETVNERGEKILILSIGRIRQV